MKIKFVKFLKRLSIYTLLIIVIFTIFHFTFNKIYLSHKYLILLLFFYLSSLFFYFLLLFTAQKKFAMFTSLYMVITMIKLLTYTGVLFFVLFVFKPYNQKIFILGFLIFYFLYWLFELIYNILETKKNSNQ